MPPDLSVVIPIYNESPNIRQLHAELVRTLDAWGLAYRTCESDDDPTEALLDALEGARELAQPVALVMARELS